MDIMEQMVITAPQTLTATQLPGLLPIIEQHGATNMVESSIPSVAKCLRSMMDDPILRTMPFDQVSFGEIVVRILKSGTPLERAALGRHLTPNAAFFFPSVSNQIEGRRPAMAIQTAIDKILKPMFGLLCDHFGVAFSGNMDTVAYSLMTEFGGLSFADFLICFERVKNGRYLRDTQHIMTRGINYEFMVGWLNEYAEEREQCRAEIYSQHRPENVKNPIHPDIAIRLNDAAKNNVGERREQTKRAADDAFAEWENGLYSSGVIRQGFKMSYVEKPLLDKDGQIQYNDHGIVTKRFAEETMCDPDDPSAIRFDDFTIRVPNPGTMERKVKRIIFEFVAFHDRTLMESFFAEYVDRVRQKYDDEPHVEKHVESELKILVSSFGTMKRKFTPEFYIRSVFKQLHPNAPDSQIDHTVRLTIDDMRKTYFDTYLPDCIATKYPRLEYDEFLISQALPEFIKHGFLNPFSALFQ